MTETKEREAYRKAVGTTALRVIATSIPTQSVSMVATLPLMSLALPTATARE